MGGIEIDSLSLSVPLPFYSPKSKIEKGEYNELPVVSRVGLLLYHVLKTNFEPDI